MTEKQFSTNRKKQMKNIIFLSSLLALFACASGVSPQSLGEAASSTTSNDNFSSTSDDTLSSHNFDNSSSAVNDDSFKEFKFDVGWGGTGEFTSTSVGSEHGSPKPNEDNDDDSMMNTSSTGDVDNTSTSEDGASSTSLVETSTGDTDADTLNSESSTGGKCK